MAAVTPQQIAESGMLSRMHKDSLRQSLTAALSVSAAMLLICLVPTAVLQNPVNTRLSSPSGRPSHVPWFPWTTLGPLTPGGRKSPGLTEEASSQAFQVRFLAVGDWGRNGTHNQSLVAQQMGLTAEAFRPQFVVSTGDNFYDSGLPDDNAEQFSLSFSEIYTSMALSVPWYSVLGNHDYYGNVLAQLSPRLPLRDIRWHCARSMHLSLPLCPGSLRSHQTLCRSHECGTRRALITRDASGVPASQRRGKEVGDAQEQGTVLGCDDSLDIFFFDTTPLVHEYRIKTKRRLDWRGLHWGNWSRQESEQLQELDGWLASSQATWKMVIGHHPAYSYGHHGDQKEILQRVDPLLRKHGVHIYMNGHDHNLQHIKRPDSPVHYVTNGAGSKAWREFPPQEPFGLEYFWPGQGFAAVQASPAELKVTFYGIFGDVLHKFSLKK